MINIVLMIHESSKSHLHCELEVQVMRNIETGIYNSKLFNVLKFCESCHCDKPHLVENEINQEPSITTNLNRIVGNKLIGVLVECSTYVC